MTCTIIYVTLVQVSGIACLGEGVTSLTASSFMGVVAMETWRPQKVWEKNKGPCNQSLESMWNAFGRNSRFWTRGLHALTLALCIFVQQYDFAHYTFMCEPTVCITLKAIHNGGRLGMAYERLLVSLTVTFKLCCSKPWNRSLWMKDFTNVISFMRALFS